MEKGKNPTPVYAILFMLQGVLVSCRSATGVRGTHKSKNANWLGALPNS